ncbi:MAG: hypothetical protein DHS20C18_47200 [Saprospiraceae bacterium]|nr:MAG: hypothetical protein DHS20C18_47200 [Saprospiraceae bacterium]
MAETEKPKSTTEDETQSGNPRPGNGDIRVFLVGINNYRNINNLGGCIDDLDRVETFLKTRFGITPNKPAAKNVGDPIDNFRTYPIALEGYGTLKICRLEDEQATYANIIRGFREFLKPAGVSDRVWFHYSGHGTEAPTALEFQELEDGSDQCLICHDYEIDEETGVFQNLLADKELAVLLNEVASGDGGTPHIVVTLDCCHSGGGTREGALQGIDDQVGIRTLILEDNAENRSLSSYLSGHYVDEMANSGRSTPFVPGSPHVVMTACNNLQLAGERGGGFFTNGLIDALESVGGKISYADLQVRARAAVHKLRSVQTPQFDVLGGAKAYTRFLEGVPEGDPDKYEVKFQDGNWTIQCGAIHGLPTTAVIQQIATTGTQPIILEIYSFEGTDNDKPLAKAIIKEVGPQYSTIEFTEGEFSLGNTLYGMLNYFPAAPEYVLITGAQEARENFIANWKEYSKIGAKNIHFLTQADANIAHELEVVIAANGYQIKDLQTGKFVDMDYKLETPDEVLYDLIQIVNWRRLISLENNDPGSTLKEKIKFEVNFEGDNGLAQDEGFQGEEIQFVATAVNGVRQDNPNERFYWLLPKITITGKTEPLYFYLLGLWSWYEISAEEEKKTEGILEPGDTKVLAFPFDEERNWGLFEGEDKDTLYYKLIVTSDELDYHQLLQDGIFDGRGKPKKVLRKPKGFKDWCAITMKVDLVREEALEQVESD